jgi:hypothetical protein
MKLAYASIMTAAETRTAATPPYEAAPEVLAVAVPLCSSASCILRKANFEPGFSLDTCKG